MNGWTAFAVSAAIWGLGGLILHVLVRSHRAEHKDGDADA